jgi:biotin carboxyl carrier protein
MLNTVNTVDLESALGTLDIKDLGEGVYEISSPNEKSIVLEVLSIDLALKTMTIRHQHSVHDIVLKDNLDLVLDKMGIKRSVDTISTDIKAPMPGKVIDIIVAEGDTVLKGDGILILEAMKMENVLKAEHDCTIKKVLVSTGISVEKAQVLIELG